MSDATKKIKALVKKAEDQGWRVRVTSKNHYRLTPPTGDAITLASTPGRGNRSVDNSIAALKRAGLQIDN